jgi:hypothetical protein
MDALEFSVFAGFADNSRGGVINTATITVVDYAQLGEVELNIGSEQIIEGAELDWVAETSNEVSAQNLFAVLDAQIPSTYPAISFAIDGAVITATSTGTMEDVTTSDAVNLTVSLSST